MNKKILLVAASVALVAVFAFLLFFKDPKPLQVNEIGNPEKHTEVIAITGIVAAPSDFYKDIFGIMDTKEATCNKGCEKIYIAVRYPGELPAPGDEVRVKGHFARVGEFFVFDAEKVKVVRKQALPLKKNS